MEKDKLDSPVQCQDSRQTAAKRTKRTLDITNHMENISGATRSLLREIAGKKARLKELWTFMHEASYAKMHIYEDLQLGNDME